MSSTGRQTARARSASSSTISTHRRADVEEVTPRGVVCSTEDVPPAWRSVVMLSPIGMHVCMSRSGSLAHGSVLSRGWGIDAVIGLGIAMVTLVVTTGLRGLGQCRIAGGVQGRKLLEERD